MKYHVWVGSQIVSCGDLTKKEADKLAEYWTKQGFGSHVIIESLDY